MIMFTVFFLVFVLQWRLQKIKLTCEGCYHLIRDEMREVTDFADRIKERTSGHATTVDRTSSTAVKNGPKQPCANELGS